jgi:hypothetical protein
MTEQFKAVGLHDALELVPISLLVTALGILLATRTFPADAKAMSERVLPEMARGNRLRVLFGRLEGAGAGLELHLG